MYQKPSLKRLGSFGELTRQGEATGSNSPVAEKTPGVGDSILVKQVPIAQGSIS